MNQAQRVTRPQAGRLDDAGLGLGLGRFGHGGKCGGSGGGDEISAIGHSVLVSPGRIIALRCP
jgi:hypothetical protein